MDRDSSALSPHISELGSPDDSRILRQTFMERVKRVTVNASQKYPSIEARLTDPNSHFLASSLTTSVILHVPATVGLLDF